MKNFLNKQNLLILIIIISSIIVIIFSAKNINLNSSIKYLFPYNKTTERSISLAEKSPVSDKVIVYIEVNNSNTLQNAVMEIDKIIDNSSLSFSNAIPGIDDINQIMDYTQENSILLYPFREDNNPFTDRETKKRLEGKADYLASLSFISPSKSFFLDPLNLSFTVLNEANKSYKGKFTPMYGGVVSSDKKAYIKILKSGFFNEDYKKIKFLKELDDKIVSGSKNKGFKAFLFSSHLFFLESQTRSRNEVTIIFFVSNFIIIFTPYALLYMNIDYYI